jgi:predicted nucleic acid-binding protein
LAERTFLDTSVLLAAHHGKPSQRNRCLAIVDDSDRFFVASPFLYLETVPKAIYHRNEQEIEFYRTYFDNVRIWINDLESILRIAREESERCGLAAMDALHVATAHLAEAEVLYIYFGAKPEANPSNESGARGFSRFRMKNRPLKPNNNSLTGASSPKWTGSLGCVIGIPAEAPAPARS